MTTAKAAVFMGPNQPFEVREFPVVPAPAGTARLSLLASGICGTDAHIHKGRLFSPPGRIIGHEFVGTVENISEEDSRQSGWKIGDRAIVDIACPCGHCKLCRTGDDANCIHMGVTNSGDPENPPYLHGGYARKTFAPLANLVKIPESLDPITVCVYACVGSTIMHAVSLAEQAGWRSVPGDTAVVQGLGPMGTFAVALLASKGLRVAAVTTHKNPRREEAARELGAEQVFTLEDDAIEDKIKEMTGGCGADVCMEASGAPDAFPMGLNLLRNRGVYIVPGQYSVSGGISVSPEVITFKALQIIGSSQYSLCDVRAYLDFLEAHPELCQIFRRFAATYPLEEINQAMADAEAGKNIKTVLI